MAKTDTEYLDALQNARLVTNAERYYRAMYYGGAKSWNLRDSHMFETLQVIMEAYPDARVGVWEHNSHVGDARATEMSARGEHNVGQLAREAFGDDAYIVGFGTHTGKVAAADRWGEEVKFKEVVPSHEESYERLFYKTGIPKLMLPLRQASNRLRRELERPRLQRAIGVIYRPQTELASHYFQAVLPKQFDEYIWFDTTNPVDPLGAAVKERTPDTYPFGL
jgi:protein-L-isoaspartate(D-aspartate) O-methyltransferase